LDIIHGKENGREESSMNKKIFLTIVMVLILGLTTTGITACGCGKATAQTQPATPRVTTAPKPAATSSQLTDGFGEPVIMAKFGEMDKTTKISISNAKYGISLTLEYTWYPGGLYGKVTNDGSQPFGTGTGIHAEYFNERNERISFADGLDLGQLKPGESRQIRWGVYPDSRSSERDKINSNWSMGLSIRVVR